MLQILVAPISKPVEEMSEEELNVCLTCFYKSARKKKAPYYKILLKNPRWSLPSVDAAQQTPLLQNCLTVAKRKVENLIKQLFRSSLLDARLLIANSPLTASLAI